MEKEKRERGKEELEETVSSVDLRNQHEFCYVPMRVFHLDSYSGPMHLSDEFRSFVYTPETLFLLCFPQRMYNIKRDPEMFGEEY